jgi:hypothetical protein
VVQIDWGKISPKTLLAISESFIQPNTPEAADRQWLCAVYAIQTGQTDVGRQLAGSAAKSKSEYRDQIEFLIPPTLTLGAFEQSAVRIVDPWLGET